MKLRLFTRVFDRYTIFCYLAAIALMLFISGTQRSPLSLFLGFSAQNSAGGLDILKLWNGISASCHPSQPAFFS